MEHRILRVLLILGVTVGMAGGLQVVTAEAQCPPSCPAAGGKSKSSDCFAEFNITGVTAAAKGFKVTCTDGDPACDVGAVPDQCDFDVSICVNNQDPLLTQCLPEGVSTVAIVNKNGDADIQTLQDAITAVLPAEVGSNICSGGATISVPVKVKGNGKRKKGKRTFKVTAQSAVSSKKDPDKLQLTCLPATTEQSVFCPVNPQGGPSRATFRVGPGTDLDTGYTGISHNQGVVQESLLHVCLAGCDVATNPVCTGGADTGPGTINGATFGAPLPLSTGGVPVCVVNEYREPVVLNKLDLTTGEVDLQVRLLAKVHQGESVNQPCPICRSSGGGGLGASGRCVTINSNVNGKACVVDGLSSFGDVSTDCPPDANNNIGNLEIDLDNTSDVTLLTQTIPCSGGSCACAGQPRVNDCDSSNQCSENEPPCPTGILPGIDQQCCNKAGTKRGCYLGDIEREGIRMLPAPPWGDTTYPKTIADGVLASTFCIAATTSTIVNGTAGLPGPGALLLPGVVTLYRPVCTEGAQAGTLCDSSDDCPEGTCE